MNQITLEKYQLVHIHTFTQRTMQSEKHQFWITVIPSISLVCVCFDKIILNVVIVYYATIFFTTNDR